MSMMEVEKKKGKGQGERERGGRGGREREKLHNTTAMHIVLQEIAHNQGVCYMYLRDFDKVSLDHGKQFAERLYLLLW